MDQDVNDDAELNGGTTMVDEQTTPRSQDASSENNPQVNILVLVVVS